MLLWLLFKLYMMRIFIHFMVIELVGFVTCYYGYCFSLLSLMQVAMVTGAGGVCYAAYTMTLENTAAWPAACQNWLSIPLGSSSGPCTASRSVRYYRSTYLHLHLHI